VSVVVVIRFLIRFLNYQILGVKLMKTDSSIPEFLRASRQQTDRHGEDNRNIFTLPYQK